MGCRKCLVAQPFEPQMKVKASCGFIKVPFSLPSIRFMKIRRSSDVLNIVTVHEIEVFCGCTHYSVWEVWTDPPFWRINYWKKMLESWKTKICTIKCLLVIIEFYFTVYFDLFCWHLTYSFSFIAPTYSSEWTELMPSRRRPI